MAVIVEFKSAYYTMHSRTSDEQASVQIEALERGLQREHQSTEQIPNASIFSSRSIFQRGISCLWDCWTGPCLCKCILVNSIMGSSQQAACLLVHFFKEVLQPTFRANSVLIASTKSRRKLKRLTSLCGSLERWWLVPSSMAFIFH